MESVEADFQDNISKEGNDNSSSLACNTSKETCAQKEGNIQLEKNEITKMFKKKKRKRFRNGKNFIKRRELWCELKFVQNQRNSDIVWKKQEFLLSHHYYTQVFGCGKVLILPFQKEPSHLLLYGCRNSSLTPTDGNAIQLYGC